jgi:hypothetical protein
MYIALGAIGAIIACVIGYIFSTCIGHVDDIPMDLKLKRWLDEQEKLKRKRGK